MSDAHLNVNLQPVSDSNPVPTALAPTSPGVAELADISSDQMIGVITSQIIAAGASSAVSVAVGGACRKVVLSPTVDSWVALGATPTAVKATAPAFFLAAGAQSYPVRVVPGVTKIAVIADSGTGYLSIIESE